MCSSEEAEVIQQGRCVRVGCCDLCFFDPQMPKMFRFSSKPGLRTCTEATTRRIVHEKSQVLQELNLKRLRGRGLVPITIWAFREVAGRSLVTF